MPTDHSSPLSRAPEVGDSELAGDSVPVASISHLTHVLGRYRSVIAVAMGGVLLAYGIVGLLIYVLSPSQRIIAQPFRLDFEGATQAKYPNGEKFGIADIISGPVLSRAYTENHLERYLSFPDFTRSVFVLESNREYEQLEADYQSKMADPRLMPVDRERLQREFELRAQSIAKNDYTLNFTQTAGKAVPDPIVRKVLLDVLNDWAEFEVKQQHVLTYRVAVLSPDVALQASDATDLVGSVVRLRATINEVAGNAERLEMLPGATLTRAGRNRVSLAEVRLRLNELSRFQLEPLLIALLRSPITNRAAAIAFFQTQVAYDQRQLDSAERLTDSARAAIAVYEQPSAADRVTSTAEQSPEKTKSPNRSGQAEPVVPQLSDTFLDRLMTLTSHAADVDFRQGLVKQYRQFIADTIPLRSNLAFDSEMLAEAQKPAEGSGALDDATARARIATAREELRNEIGAMNDIFQAVSRNMGSSTQLFQITSPATTRVARSASARQLALIGVLVLLIAFPAIIVFAVLHNRVREEDESAAALHGAQFTAS